jgi:hypothetical protein
MFITVRRIFAFRATLVSCFSVRRIPENSTRSGSTFLALPPWKEPMDRTAGSAGDTVRPTSSWRAVTTLQAAAITSSPLWGSAPWVPLPLTTQSNMSDAALKAPR